ncbi:MAG: tRNA (guanosine(37)-N1)-methyltransferase TrmD [Dehalococcoidia bacterium]
MQVHILTLFPRMFDGPFSESILQRARKSGLIDIQVHNIRDYARDKHKVVDDYPYGGGAGMVMKPEPIFEAVEDVKARIRQKQKEKRNTSDTTPVVLLSPKGRVFNQKIAHELSQNDGLILICGHYEGVDERIRQHIATDEISLGDYVITGGELAAMVVVDAVARLIPEVLGSEESLENESHTDGLLQHPQYTRPPEYRGMKVPEILLSGRHQEIAQWRRRQSLLETLRKRPDLLERAQLTDEEKRLLERAGGGEGYLPE